MNNYCPVCGELSGTGYVSPFSETDDPLCGQCARIDIVSWIGDCDKGEVAKLRRRAEDCLRKNPGQLRETLVHMVIAGAIEYQDCI